MLGQLIPNSSSLRTFLFVNMLTCVTLWEIPSYIPFNSLILSLALINCSFHQSAEDFFFKFQQLNLYSIQQLPFSIRSVFCFDFQLINIKHTCVLFRFKLSFYFLTFLGKQSCGLPYVRSSTQGKVLLCLIYNVYREDCFNRAGLSQELSMPHPLSPLWNAFVHILLGISEVPKLGSGIYITSSLWTTKELQRFRLVSFPLVPYLFFQSPQYPGHGKEKKPNTTTSGSIGRRLLHLNSWFIHSSSQRQLCFFHFFTYPWKILFLFFS